jgi:hypothetical protein
MDQDINYATFDVASPTARGGTFETAGLALQPLSGARKSFGASGTNASRQCFEQ